MTTKQLFLRTLVLLLVSLSGCGSPGSAPTPAFTGIPTENKFERVSVLVSTDEIVKIKREGWADYQPIGFGALIYPTDLLRTDGKILILCPDFQTVMPFTGLGRNPCPLSPKETVLIYDQMYFFSATRKSSPPLNIPYILYPRSTVILESHPVLQWNNTRASSYSVELWDGANLVWKQPEVSGNSISYPSNAPNLKPNTDYLLVITDNDSGKDSKADPDKGLGFQLVNQTQASEMEKQKETILSFPDLNPVARKLALALYYDQINVNDRGLWSEASKLLREITNVQTDSPAVHLRAGNLFEKMKLWDEAQKEYEIALAQAKNIDDLESQADANAAIWLLTRDQTRFDQAINIYEKLGAQHKADALKEEEKP